ncbi:glycerol-3-phosphate acyltransferase [Paenibacillus rhizovicinus]|uniref:Glycerol-3-phosphate acyltransferase n=1 Tax=Paenibacillus rhizovicinus TaxID=2704463 RepID=A0A6C0P094_9BACL|nr:glycerol-3-phosphate acyltransferase [Paenibacillus rhizovicinus]QHW31879.1 glycerol-3-phosphate acyltransferase [Paenibacillus rhizovicinus]
MIMLWTLLSFLSGSLMFSYWLGLLANHNLKDVGDGNPGALNLWRAAGYTYGLAGIALDFLKGYVPVVVLIATGSVEGYGIVLPSAAAILGHAFSPFMRGRGGKAIAVTFGVWSALTGFAASLAYAVILALLLAASRIFTRGKPTSSDADGFQVVLGMLLLAIFLIAGRYSGAILLCWLASFLLLVYTHRKELRRFFARFVQQRS